MLPVPEAAGCVIPVTAERDQVAVAPTVGEVKL